MKFPFSMLLDFVETDSTPELISDLLTMAGFEVEGVESVEGDAVFDVKVMSNRGDGLSVFGLAREVLAKLPDAAPTSLYRLMMEGCPMSDEDDAAVRALTAVTIESPDCNRYACRLFEFPPAGDAPEWIQKRIRQAGMRSLGLIVDLTNYVMLELGQPLHAFDLDRLADKCMVVRSANDGEKITTLNGEEHELDSSMLMICDSERPVAVAGVMGGAETEVTPQTTRILLESAHFDSISVRRTRKALGLSTEASYRFERSVDPNGVVRALNRFAQLLDQIDDGASRVTGVIDDYPGEPLPRFCNVRMSRAKKLLGMEVPTADAHLILTRLGFNVEGNGEPFVVEVPTWRPDIIREDDIVEEIGRVYGYDKIPEMLPFGHTTQGSVTGLPRLKDRVRDVILRLGYTQVMTHTLRDRHPLDYPENDRVQPRNPHSPETAWLRNSCLPGISEVLLRNGAHDLHLFEIGQVFVRGEIQIDESPELAFMSVGRLIPDHWGDNASPEVAFPFIKGTALHVAEVMGVDIVVRPPIKPDLRFHPTRQASMLVGKGLFVGTIGQIHPDVAAEIGVPESTMMGEMDLLVLASEPPQEIVLKQFSRNPAVRRDVSFLIPKSMAFSKIEEAIHSQSMPELEKFWLFDVYEGKGIPEGEQSLSIALQLRKFGGNLTDDEANQARDRVAEALKSVGATLR